MSPREAASALVIGVSAAFAGASAVTVDDGDAPSAGCVPAAPLAEGDAPGAASWTSTGETGEPFATEPAMMAAASGDIRTLPCPIMAAAWSVPSASPGTEPRKASAPSFGASTATPSDVAADSSCACDTLSRTEMKAVLQECANASRSVTEPSESAGYPSAFLNFRPSTVRVGVHCTFESGVNPLRSMASESTTLNVDPGAY